MRAIMLCLCGIVLVTVGTMPLVASARTPEPVPAVIQSVHGSSTVQERQAEAGPDNTGDQVVVIIGAGVLLGAAFSTRARKRPALYPV